MKFKFENIIVKTVLILTILASSSCDLDEDPESFIDERDFYSNETEVNLAVVSVYNSMYEVMDLEWNVTELRSDNTFFNPDRSPESDADRFTLDRLIVSTNNGINANYYRACYGTIALANIVLENLEVVEDEARRNQFEGEAKFFRSLMHFNLVRLYSGIAIVDRTLFGEEAFQVSRSTEDEVYEFIKNDLREAVDLLPIEYADEELGRVTSWSAKTLLGKVLLTNGEYGEAITALESVKNEGPFNLVSDYGLIFDESNEMNDEIIFAVRYQSGSVGLGSPFPNDFAPLQSDDFVARGNGAGQNLPTESISDAYLTDGDRKESSMRDFYLNGNDVAVEDQHIIKYNSDFQVFEDAPRDWPVLRYADVLLMLAEAYIEGGRGVQPALEEINAVRTRAGLEAYVISDLPTIFDAKLALELERRLEFAFENHRFYDLVRTNRALTVINEHFDTEPAYIDPSNITPQPIAPFQLTLPIPQREIDLNPNLSQNIGY